MSLSSESKDLEPFGVNYRFENHIPGYSGFIPKFQFHHGLTFASATRAVMACPPTPDFDTTVTMDYRVGRRRVMTSSPILGTGFSSLRGLDPSDEDDNVGPRTFLQGGPVNLASYYEDLQRKVDRMRKENPKSITQRKNPLRNRSQVTVGDGYYYTGKHMFTTTFKESYDEKIQPESEDESPNLTRSFSDLRQSNLSSPKRLQTPNSGANASFARLPSTGSHQLTTASSILQRSASTGSRRAPSSKTSVAANRILDPTSDDPLIYRYSVAQAIVGKSRVDDLNRQLAERVTAKVTSAPKDMMKLFNFYARTGADLGHPIIGHMEFLHIVQTLGIYITFREALALFGRYDVASSELNGQLEYFEFINLFLESHEQVACFL
uniref:EF-hand domain-containing protein n=1 Tax=Guillardia theta TaxID=55529 RepID=A0A7S4KPR6_GUITH|mmetsp:Transcript_2839/g.9537  ORF Transcript_2839/g.9537 Transcript_2839/m.9537 type:complete len:379 (+) Transcript_2839:370-1506(+)